MQLMADGMSSGFQSCFQRQNSEVGSAKAIKQFSYRCQHFKQSHRSSHLHVNMGDKYGCLQSIIYDAFI